VAEAVARAKAPNVSHEASAALPRPVFGSPGVVPEVEPDVGPNDGTHSGPVIVLWSRATAAWERSLPFKVAPACILILVPERMLPTRVLFVPRMLPAETSRHQTLHGSPPVTVDAAEVVKVAADLKIQTPEPLRVKFPVSRKASAQYTPGPRGETVVRSFGPVPDQLVVHG
jgi:hypothetical protein